MVTGSCFSVEQTLFSVAADRMARLGLTAAGERRVERSLAQLGRVPGTGGLAGKEGELAG